MTVDPELGTLRTPVGTPVATLDGEGAPTGPPTGPEHAAEPWRGTLEVYRGGDAWRGHIRFQRDGEEGHFRTGEIFRENNLQDLRDRFSSFTAPTLSAFLRSTLP